MATRTFHCKGCNTLMQVDYANNPKFWCGSCDPTPEQEELVVQYATLDAGEAAFFKQYEDQMQGKVE